MISKRTYNNEDVKAAIGDLYKEDESELDYYRFYSFTSDLQLESIETIDSLFYFCSDNGKVFWHDVNSDNTVDAVCISDEHREYGELSVAINNGDGHFT